MTGRRSRRAGGGRAVPPSGPDGLRAGAASHPRTTSGAAGYGRAVRTIRGEHRLPPRAVGDAVFALARQLGRAVAGDGLFLVAVAGLDGDPPARRALEAEGLSAERLLGEVRTGGDGPPDGEFFTAGLQYTYTYSWTSGWADGFAAAASGDGTITPEHVLLALLWDPMSQSSQLLWNLGVAREAVVERLRELGVTVPRAPLPRQYEVEMGERVWFGRDQVTAVIRHVPRRLPPGAHFGFNYDGDRAWAWAEASVDLEALVREALAAG